MLLFSKYFFVILSGHNINRHVENLRDLQDGIDMSARGCRKMMGRAAFAPAGYKLSCAAGKAGSHIGIAKGKDLSFLIDPPQLQT